MSKNIKYNSIFHIGRSIKKYHLLHFQTSLYIAETPYKVIDFVYISLIISAIKV